MTGRMISRLRIVLTMLCLLQAVRAADPIKFVSATPQSQGISSELLAQLAAEVEGYVRDEKVPGAELLVIKNRRTILHQSFGWRDRETRTPMSLNSIFNIRSMTKPVTGTALQMLIEDGELGIDDPVARHLPAFDNETSREITIKHLLTHRSGLSWLTGTAQGSLQMIADSCGELGPQEFLPGTSFGYSDGGSDTIGAIVERTSGTPLDAFMTERILQPLGMNNTFGLHDASDPRLKRCASRYENSSGRLQPVWKPGDGAQFPFMRGSQGLASTPMDYARFLALWLDRGMAGDKRLLSAASVARGLTPVSLAGLPTGFPHTRLYYGCQWMLYLGRNAADPDVWGHSGSDGTFAWVWPRQDLMVLYFTQCTNTSTGFSLEQVIDRLLIHPESHEATVPEKLQAYTGFYWSSEANMYRAIVGCDDTLAIEVPGMSRATLQATQDPDRWICAEQKTTEFRFTRNSKGRIDALIPPAYTGAKPQMKFDTDPQLPGIDQLMTTHLMAHGTHTAGTLGVFQMTGTMDLKAQRMKVTNRLISDGLRCSREEMTMGGTVVQAVVCRGDQVRILGSTGMSTSATGIEREQTILARLAVVIGDWRKYYQQLQVVRRIRVAGKETYVVRATAQEGPATTYLVDAKTGLTVQSLGLRKTPVGFIGQTTLYEDYRDIEGVKIPFRWTIRSPHPLGGDLVLQYDAIETHLKGNDQVFVLR